MRTAPFLGAVALALAAGPGATFIVGRVGRVGRARSLCRHADGASVAPARAVSSIGGDGGLDEEDEDSWEMDCPCSDLGQAEEEEEEEGGGLPAGGAEEPSGPGADEGPPAP